MGRPAPSEAAEYYFTYINQVEGDDVLSTLRSQLTESGALLESINEERSQYRPAADKWSIRQVLSHINDAERLFAFRAFWFARGLGAELPSFDQEIAARHADAESRAWSHHLEEFRAVRAGTLALFEQLPPDAWSRSGTASGMQFSVRALAFITAGHFAHHMRILRERYS